MFEDLDDDELALCRRALAAVGWQPGMVTVLLDASGQLPGPAVNGDDFELEGALPDLRSPWTQRALLDLVRARTGDPMVRIEPVAGGYAVAGSSGGIGPERTRGWPTPGAALVAALDPDGEPEEVS